MQIHANARLASHALRVIGLRTRLSRRESATAPVRGRGRRSSTTCYTYRGGEDERRRRGDELASTHATPPLKANRAFLSDPFCTIAEDSDGLPGFICPPDAWDEEPELGPTFRYVEWDFEGDEQEGRFYADDKEDDRSAGGDVKSVEDAAFDRNIGSGGGGGGEERSSGEDEEELTDAGKTRAANGINECTIGEDEDGMPALDCPLPY